jgi:hypothetical protein
MTSHQKVLLAFAAVAGATTLGLAVGLLFGDSTLVSRGPEGPETDPLAWGLVFLLGGLTAVFGLASVIQSPRGDQGGGRDPEEQALDQLEKGLRAIRVLSKGVEAVAGYTHALHLVLLESASSKAQAAKMAIGEAAKQAARLDELGNNETVPALKARLDDLLPGPTDAALKEAIQLATAIQVGPGSEASEVVSNITELLETAKAALLGAYKLNDAARVLIEQR